VDHLLGVYSISISRACKLVNLARSMYSYESKRNDTPVVEQLQALAEKHPTEGFWKMFYRMRRNNTWNHKRVHRIYKLMKLNICRKAKKRLPARVKQPLVVPQGANITWSMDFMSDALVSTRKFRVLNILDDFNREVLAVEIDFSVPAIRIIRVLNNLIEWRGKPKAIRVDNGPEFVSHALTLWCEDNQITLQYIQPGKPTQNAYVERFNRSFRRGVLDAYLFETLDQVREISTDWILDYNTDRPHEGLGNRSPMDFWEPIGGVPKIHRVEGRIIQTEFTSLKLS
jgi:putative transposase